MNTNPQTISTLAYVHPGAKIGADVVIEPFAVIHDDVVIGDGCWIASNAVLYSGTRLEANCQIYPGAVIGAVPQDLKYRNEYTTVEIGEGTMIREFVTIHRGTSHSHKTVIGKKALIMAYSHVAHDCMIGDYAILANTVNLAGHVHVGEYAVIGGSSAVHQFSLIGKHAIVAGGSMIGKDIPPYTKVGRDPVSYAGINYKGLTRRGFPQEKIREIQEIYRVIFLSGINRTQALERVEAEFPYSAERDEILSFIRTSERGIMKGYAFLAHTHSNGNGN